MRVKSVSGARRRSQRYHRPWTSGFVHRGQSRTIGFKRLLASIWLPELHQLPHRM